jgi:hypothetical protein
MKHCYILASILILVTVTVFVGGSHIKTIELQNDSQELEIEPTQETLPGATIEQNSEWQEIMIFSTNTSRIRCCLVFASRQIRLALVAEISTSGLIMDA